MRVSVARAAIVPICWPHTVTSAAGASPTLVIVAVWATVSSGCAAGVSGATVSVSSGSGNDHAMLWTRNASSALLKLSSALLVPGLRASSLMVTVRASTLMLLGYAAPCADDTNALRSPIDAPLTSIWSPSVAQSPSYAVMPRRMTPPAGCVGAIGVLSTGFLVGRRTCPPCTAMWRFAGTVAVAFANFHTTVSDHPPKQSNPCGAQTLPTVTVPLVSARVTSASAL